MRTFTIKWVLYGIILVLCSLLSYADLPNEFIIEAFVSTYDSEDNKNYPLQGDFSLNFQLLKEDGTVVFEKQQDIFVVLGIVTIAISDEDDFDSAVFSDDLLHAKITLEELDINYTGLNITSKTSNANLQSAESITIPIHSLNRAILTNTSVKANKFLNEDLISVNEPSLNVSIATTNLVDSLHVDGNINATAFIGDASLLENLDYIRWISLYERIYYDKGYVGVGLAEPEVHLHVSGNLFVSQNAAIESPPLLVIRDSLISTFNGDAQQITSFNADEFSHGIIANQHLFGDYISITGLGTVSTGTWNASIILDHYIRDNLLLNGSILHNFSINSTLNTQNDLYLFSHSNTYPFSIHSALWSLNENSTLSTINTSEVEIGSEDIIISDSLQFKSSDKTIFSINPSGNLSLFDADSVVEFNPSFAIQVGASDATEVGTIRLNEYFEGHSSNGWYRMDMLGNFTGHSLFKEGDLSSEIIKVHSDAMIGINVKNPKESLDVSGNIVFIGSTTADDPSEDITTGNYWAWISNKGALRFGESNVDSAKNTASNIGLYSVGIGDYAASSGQGAINITHQTTTLSYSNSLADNTVIIAGNLSTNSGVNTVILSSESLSMTGENNIYMSSHSSGMNVSGTNNVFLNGFISGNHPYNNTVVGGKSATNALGNNSFLWQVNGLTSSFKQNNDNTFTIAPGIKVGINTNEFDSTDLQETLVVNGTIKADYFEGFGSLLSGDIRTEYLTVEIDGVIENIYPTHNTVANHLYVSDNSGFMPENSVDGTSISDGSITGDNFDGYSIDSHKIEENSITTESFADASIVYDTLSGDDLDTTKFSGITGSDFEDDSIDETKLATDSIYTIHFVDEAVTTIHILEDTVNSPLNNIALHAITTADMVVELLISQYFGNEGIGFNIANEALYTVTDNSGIVESHFVWETAAGVHDPQIQEQHIAAGAVNSYHIPNQNINSDALSDSSIDTSDLTTNVTAGIIPADDRTVDDVVFIARHFEDDALTNDKFNDECPADECATPTENFQIMTDQIADEAIAFDGGGIDDEIATAAVLQDDIVSKNIVGRHIKELSVETSKFQDASIFEEHLNDDSISSEKIEDYTLQIEDFAEKSIEGINITTSSLTSRELDENSISGSQLSDNSIGSNHIAYKTLGLMDFAPGAITNDKISGGTITSENLIDGSIDASLLTNLILTEEKFADNGVSWDDFVQPPEAYFPVELFDDNSLNFDEKFTDETLSADTLMDGSIGADQLNIPTFSVDKLATPLAVENGGTGITSFIEHALLYSYNDNGETRLGQSNNLRYEYDNPNGILFLDPPQNIPTNFSGLITSGNILIENGALILESYDDSTYTFLKYDSVSEAIQTTYRESLDYTSSNMNLKAKQLLLNTSMIIGSETALNGLDLTTGFALGTSFRSETIPENGLIIEDQLHVGGNYPSLTGTLVVNEGNAYAVSDNIGAIFDMTGSATLSTPILAKGVSILATGNIGISSEAPEPLNVSISGSGTKTGIDATIISDGTNYPVTGVYSSKDSLESHMAYAETTFSAGIYGKEPTTSEDYNYSGYFAGNLGATSLTFDDETPSFNLIVDSVKLDGLFGKTIQSGIINTIDWRAGNIATVSIGDDDRTLIFSSPPDESTLLMLIVEHTGYGLVSFSSSDIKWYDNYIPELTNISGRTDIVIFRYIANKFGGGTYYGSAVYNFTEPI